MLRNPALAAGALALVIVAGGCAPELNWREWRTESPGVSMLFPCKPVRQQRTVTLDSEPRVLVLHVCDAGGVSWAVALVDVESVARTPGVVKALVDGLHANLGQAREVAAGPSPKGFDAVPGTGRYRVEGQVPDGRGRVAEHLVLVVGPRVVQVSALGERLDAEALDNFLGSVRVMK